MTAAPTPVHQRAPRHHSRWVAALLFLVLVETTLLLVLLFRSDAFDGSSSPGVHGSGIAVSQTRELALFKSVELAGSNNVIVDVGHEQSVVVHADDNLLRYVTTRVRAMRLVVGNLSGSFSTKSPMWVEIRVPTLTALRLTGSGTVSARGIDSRVLRATLDGNGVLRATGTATRLFADVGGSGDAQLQQLIARDVHAVVNGSGRILVTATDRLDASIPGSGAVVYLGHPLRVSTSVTGSGAVIPG